MDTSTVQQRAEDTAERIAEKPTEVVVTRVSTQLDAQTVRIDPLSRTPGERRDANTDAGTLRVLVTGYRGHATVADTDLQRGDRFYFDGVLFDIVGVQLGVPWRLEAVAEART